MGAVALAIGGLLWLRPNPILYGLGGLGILLAMIAFWIASPVGGLWVKKYVLPPEAGLFAARWAGWLFLVMFPAGWLLLASSVVRWTTGVIAYLSLGLLFASAWGAIWGMGGQLGLLPYFLLVGLLWPFMILAMLGVFGTSFGN